MPDWPLTTIPEPEAVREYEQGTSDYDRSADRRCLNYGVSAAFSVMDKADAALAAVIEELATMERMLEEVWDEFRHIIVEDCVVPPDGTTWEQVKAQWLADLRARVREGER